MVLQLLKDNSFRAGAAYPGQKYPQLKNTVAAVHIEKVDRTAMTVTVGINIISPAQLGGTACELEGLRATDILCHAGARCIQEGCSYDGLAQVYVVPVFATFTCAARHNDYLMGPGFSVYINDKKVEHAIRFQAEQTIGHQMQFAMGEAAPVGISQGSWQWELRLEELVPPDQEEDLEPVEPFTLRLQRSVSRENYAQCRWCTVRREVTQEGLRRIRTGIAMVRQVSAIE